MNEKLHLCDSCGGVFPECMPTHITFGTGFGNDNVVECSGFKEILFLEEGES